MKKLILVITLSLIVIGSVVSTKVYGSEGSPIIDEPNFSNGLPGGWGTAGEISDHYVHENEYGHDVTRFELSGFMDPGYIYYNLSATSSGGYYRLELKNYLQYGYDGYPRLQLLIEEEGEFMEGGLAYSKHLREYFGTSPGYPQNLSTVIYVPDEVAAVRLLHENPEGSGEDWFEFSEVQMYYLGTSYEEPEVDHREMIDDPHLHLGIESSWMLANGTYTTPPTEGNTDLSIQDPNKPLVLSQYVSFSPGVYEITIQTGEFVSEEYDIQLYIDKGEPTHVYGDIEPNQNYTHTIEIDGELGLPYRVRLLISSEDAYVPFTFHQISARWLSGEYDPNRYEHYYFEIPSPGTYYRPLSGREEVVNIYGIRHSTWWVRYEGVPTTEFMRNNEPQHDDAPNASSDAEWPIRFSLWRHIPFLRGYNWRFTYNEEKRELSTRITYQFLDKDAGIEALPGIISTPMQLWLVADREGDIPGLYPGEEKPPVYFEGLGKILTALGMDNPSGHLIIFGGIALIANLFFVVVKAPAVLFISGNTLLTVLFISMGFLPTWTVVVILVTLGLGAMMTIFKTRSGTDQGG